MLSDPPFKPGDIVNTCIVNIFTNRVNTTTCAICVSSCKERYTIKDVQVREKGVELGDQDYIICIDNIFIKSIEGKNNGRYSPAWFNLVEQASLKIIKSRLDLIME